MIPFPFQHGQFGLAGSQGAAPWTPANLTAPAKTWYNDSSSVTDVGGGICSEWDDLSSNGWDAIQPTATYRPLIVASALNGRRGIRFDGVDNHMFSNSGSIFQNVATGWFACVWQRTVSTGGGATRALYVGRTSSASQSRFTVLCDSAANADKISLQSRRLDADATATLSGTVAVNSGPHIVICYIDWAARTAGIRVDGAVDNTATSWTTAGSATSNTGSAANSIAATVNSPTTTMLDGDMYECIWGSGAALPSTGEFEKVEGYVAHRWGLTSLLPGGHPYKTVGPTV